jgi:transposase
MRRIREVLRLKFQLGLNDSQVANSAGIARATVQDYLRRIAATGEDPARLLALDEQALEQRLFPSRERRNPNRPLPDWPAIEQELRRRGVTLRLLWLEYLDGQTGGYQYTQFLRHFRYVGY